MTKLLFTAVLILSTLYGSAAQNEKPSLNSLAWIAGCWEANRPERKQVVVEHWMTPSGGAMIGMARTVRDGKMTGFEFLRIVEDSTGVRYISKPSQNTDETAFPLLKASVREVVFENLAHDFPQRIIYRQPKPDELHARVEGQMNGKTTGIDFIMKRAKCN